MRAVVSQQATRTFDAWNTPVKTGGEASARPPVSNQTLLRRVMAGGRPLQAKLTIGAVNDPLEREADDAADRVMRMDVRDIVQAPSPISLSPKFDRSEEEDRSVMRRADSASLDGTVAPPLVESVLRTPGRPLDPATLDFMSTRFGANFRSVRIHTDSAAAQSAAAVGARAYTVGQNVVFGTGQYDPDRVVGRRLLAHELAHTLQQAGGRFGPDGIGGDSQDQAVAETKAVIAKRKIEPQVARQVGPGESVLEALRRPDPIAGVGDPGAAMRILAGLSGTALIDAVLEVDQEFLLDVLVQHIGASDTTAAGAVIYAVRATSTHFAPDDGFTQSAARGLARLPVADRDEVLGRVLARRAGGASLAEVQEGLAAIEDSEADLTAQGTEEVDDLSIAPAQMMAGIAPGPWNPGNMPVPYYIGNAAHLGIAASYASRHLADVAFYNFTPIASILAQAALSITGLNSAALRAAQLRLRPDIANLTRRHLYEIKPVSSQALGATEAALYVTAFAAAGLPMALGPTTEPGTSGTIAAPGGWYVFSSNVPGVITYSFRQPRRRRVRVRVPETSPVPAPDRSLVERISIATGLTGAALWIYLVISEGSRVAFPPRNAIPIP